MLKIVSGGQTGVDRAALDAAIDKEIAYAGWCPKGGWAEDLPRPPGLLALYPHLKETPRGDPLQRTEWNVRDSDRLMVLLDNRGLNSSGTERAIIHAHELARPVLVLDLDRSEDIERAAASLLRMPSAAARHLHRRPARERSPRHLRCGASLPLRGP